ncbi:MAG: hypothetical protein J7576_17630 [Siphonobacter aquaeclarae]|nr:hypothetical protein [Siphonobacter aquaeclarae]
MVFRKVFLSFFLLVGILPAFAQERYLTGVAQNDSTHAPINMATVRNLRTQDVTRTNKTGTFLLLAKPGDRIRINCNGCEETTALVDSSGRDLIVNIKQFTFLTEGTTLNEVEVTGKSEAEIKNQIEAVLKEPTAKKNMSTGQVLDMAQSPISLLYELFSKRAKGLRKLAVFQQEDRKHKLAETRYNEQFVNQITKLEGLELEQFMRFCPIPDDFILRSSEYDLMQKVKDCYKKFKARQGK